MSIKNTFKFFFNPVIKVIIANPFSWHIISSFLKIGTWLRFIRSGYEHGQADKKLQQFFSDTTVRNGFFKGLKYGSTHSVGSSLYPKLLGSYEAELTDVLTKFKYNNYTLVIDIGCAEGYYAIGLAVQFPSATVQAYDTDAKALEYCKQLAAINNVTNQVQLNNSCTAATFDELKMPCTSLLICDCEGYERELFTRHNISRFVQSDLIIELHPFAAPDIKEYLLQLFCESHHCIIISSHDNARKISDYKNSLQGLTTFEEQKAVEEGRPYTMDWLVAQSSINKIERPILL